MMEDEMACAFLPLPCFFQFAIYYDTHTSSFFSFRSTFICFGRPAAWEVGRLKVQGCW